MNDVLYPSWLYISQSLVALRYCLEVVRARVGYRGSERNKALGGYIR